MPYPPLKGGVSGKDDGGSHEHCADLTDLSLVFPRKCARAWFWYRITEFINYATLGENRQHLWWKHWRWSEVYLCPRINLDVIPALLLFHTPVPSVEGVCESSRSHTNTKPFIGSHHSAKVRQGPQWLIWSFLVFDGHSSLSCWKHSANPCIFSPVHLQYH